MRALVVFESMFGNTEAIARAIARGLTRHATVHVDEVGENPTAAAYDLVVVGGPTHAFSMSRPRTRMSAQEEIDHAVRSPTIGIREWIGRAQPQTPMTLFAVFDTRIRKPHLPGSAARAAGRKLRAKGLAVVGRPHSFWVEGTQGPLYEGEIARAERWGEQLAVDVARSMARHARRSA